MLSKGIAFMTFCDSKILFGYQYLFVLVSYSCFGYYLQIGCCQLNIVVDYSVMVVVFGNYFVVYCQFDFVVGFVVGFVNQLDCYKNFGYCRQYCQRYQHYYFEVELKYCLLVMRYQMIVDQFVYFQVLNPYFLNFYLCFSYLIYCL